MWRASPRANQEIKTTIGVHFFLQLQLAPEHRSPVARKFNGFERERNSRRRKGRGAAMFPLPPLQTVRHHGIASKVASRERVENVMTNFLIASSETLLGLDDDGAAFGFRV